jgi:hypothetical protein
MQLVLKWFKRFKLNEAEIN